MPRMAMQLQARDRFMALQHGQHCSEQKMPNGLTNLKSLGMLMDFNEGSLLALGALGADDGSPQKALVTC
jgi:hypothetical protein